MPVEVRRAVPDDWPGLRALRLEALADTPLGYLETSAQGLAHPDEEWQHRARRGSEGGDSCQLFAVERERLVGTAVTFPDRDDSAAWWVAAVYLQRAVRGQGLLARLVAGLEEHARQHDARRLRLLVHEANPRARAAYARLGFAETGEREPYPLDPGGEQLAMERPLA